MYLLFIAVGFSLGILCSLSFFLHRLERLRRQEITVAPPTVQINVSAELVARYLESFNLIAIPKHLIANSDEPVTKH